ncbi:MAG: choice-of-anchor E domain-containing protein [Gemmataceae bacterium]
MSLSVPSPHPRLETLEDREVPAALGFLNQFAQLSQMTSVPAAQPTLSMQAAPMTAPGSSSLLTNPQQQSAPVVSDPLPAPTPMPSPPPPNGGVVSSEASFNASTTAQVRTATVNKFNPNLGVLTKVEISAEGTVQANAALENLSNISQTVKTHLRGTMQYQIQGLGATLNASFDRQETGHVAAFDGMADLQGVSAKQFAIQSQATFQTITLTDDASLALFSGNGTLQVASLTDANACNCGPGNLMSAIETTSQGRVRVVYHYTPASQLGSLAGYVYHDVNRNGVFNPGDRMIPGVVLTLTGFDLQGNAISRTTTTGSNGWFSFNRLPAGNYTITQTQPSGFQQGLNAAGTAGGVVTGDVISDINLQTGQNATNYSFGEITNAVVPPPPLVRPPVDPPFFSKIRFTGRFNGWL